MAAATGTALAEAVHSQYGAAVGGPPIAREQAGAGSGSAGGGRSAALVRRIAPAAEVIRQMVAEGDEVPARPRRPGVPRLPGLRP